MATDALGPALGLLELESLARGIFVADALVKQAAVHLAVAEPVSPGKYLLIFLGPVADVAESFKAGLGAGASLVLDSLHLPHVAEAVVAALLRAEVAKVQPGDAVGVVELHTVAATLKAADVALKCAQVRLTHFQLAKGIGGKGWFTVAGAQHDVEAALEGAAASVASSLLVGTELISRPHRELFGRVL